MLLPTQIIAACITASVASASVYIAYSNRQAERVKLTRDLYNQFFAMIDSRSSAWFWLEQLNSEQRTPSFEELWRRKDEVPNVSNLYRIAGFWFLVYKLSKARQLDPHLAHSFFAHELCNWYLQVAKLVRATRTRDNVFPEVFEALETDSWLAIRKRGLLPAVGRVKGATEPTPSPTHPGGGIQTT